MQMADGIAKLREMILSALAAGGGEAWLRLVRLRDKDLVCNRL
jgi:hypothetical protein